jgi:hypothetical protein
MFPKIAHYWNGYFYKFPREYLDGWSLPEQTTAFLSEIGLPSGDTLKGLDAIRVRMTPYILATVVYQSVRYLRIGYFEESIGNVDLCIQEFTGTVYLLYPTYKEQRTQVYINTDVVAFLACVLVYNEEHRPKELSVWKEGSEIREQAELGLITPQEAILKQLELEKRATNVYTKAVDALSEIDPSAIDTSKEPEPFWLTMVTNFLL